MKDFDEEDPLAGIPLSDEDDDDFGLPVKKKPVAKQPSQQKVEQPVQQKSEDTSPRTNLANQEAVKGDWWLRQNIKYRLLTWFTGLDKQKFQLKIVNIFFNIHHFNICFGYSKEPSHWDEWVGSFAYPQHMFWLRYKKIYSLLHTLYYTVLTKDLPDEPIKMGHTQNILFTVDATGRVVG